jgi:hypothetical protein
MNKKQPNKKLKRKYAKPLSLYPLKPEEALKAFMEVDPEKIKKREKKKEKG